MSKGFVAVSRVTDLAPGLTRRVVVAGHPLLIANVAGSFYAVDDMCTHEDSSLSLGCLKGELVSCTLHGSRFSVVTGESVEEPATEALRTYAVRIEGDALLVEVAPA
jgi:3-phenylpropionate/trans-cinnamate dioxygenase ferredoxin subunit